VITVLQVSDAHLSPRNGLFRRNFARVRRWAERARPDLVVATGDLSLDGAGREEDMEFAAAAHHALPAPMLAVPGNHDVGSHERTMPRQPIDGARLARFRRHSGKDRWVRDLPGWRLVGLNSEVMGAGLAEGTEQAAFVEAAAAGAGDRRIALFLHKPVFISDPEDPTFDYWSVPPHARASLAPLLRHPRLRLVGSGHLHLHRRFDVGAAAFAWAPPLSFVVHPREQEGLPGERLCGALVHRLHEDRAETELLVPHGMETPSLDDVRAETYPREPEPAHG
jgi:3',5'-cyclic AMP phosphodiesterase CpdA